MQPVPINVITDMVGFPSAILLFVFGISHVFLFFFPSFIAFFYIKQIFFSILF